MKDLTLIFLLVLFCVSCSEGDENDAGDRLLETNHTLGSVYSRYAYLNDKVQGITITGDNGQYPYLMVTYLNDSETRIRSVNYYSDIPNFMQWDTLIYKLDNLTHIIKTKVENGILKRRDTTFFLYDESNHLIQAENQSWPRKIVFSEYEGENFTRTHVYVGSQLIASSSLKYDNMVSPFKGLGFLNFVGFSNNLLEGFEYLTDNNIVELTEDEYQSVILTNTYKFSYLYNKKDRPIKVITKREGDKEFQIEEYYRYK